MVTLCQDAHDRLERVGAVHGVSVGGLLRCVAERLAEEIEFVDTPGMSLHVRGWPLPLALFRMLKLDQAPEPLERLSEILRLYRPDGAGPKATFHPKDMHAQGVRKELQRLLSSADAGATAPPEAPRKEALSLVPPPSSNTGVGLRPGGGIKGIRRGKR